jgi:hypothetical protein
MRRTLLTTPRLALAGLLAAATLATAPAQAATAAYTFTGLTDSGVFAANDFFGSFAFDSSALTPDFSGSIGLSAFSLSFRGEGYTLASADVAPGAVFVQGQFVGIDYADADSADSALRPWVVMGAGFGSLTEAYFGYETTAGPGGFGSYGVTAVPEPTAAWLMAAGLAGLGALRLRRR